MQFIKSFKAKFIFIKLPTCERPLRSLISQFPNHPITQSSNFLISLILILSISACSIQNPQSPVPSEPVKVAEKKLPDIPADPGAKPTIEAISEYARIHQISDLRVAEFYLTHSAYARENPYMPTEEDIVFYERDFLERVYPGFKKLAEEEGFKKARLIYMNNPPDGGRQLGSPEYAGIMQKFARGDAAGASSGTTNPLMESDPAAVHYQEAIKFYKDKRIDEAIQNMEKAVKAKPDSPAMLYDLGLMYMEKGDDPAAIQALKGAIENIKSTGFTGVNLAMHPGVYLGASVNLGLVYERQGMYNEAINILKEVIKFRPDDLDTNRNLANVYYVMSDMDNLVPQLQKSIKLDPKNPELHNLMGLTYYNKEFYEIALGEFQTAINLAPGEKQYSYNMGLALVRLGRQEEAEFAFKKASEFKGRDIAAEASQAFTKQLAENRLRQMYNDGCEAMQRLDIRRAIDLFNSVLNNAPDMPEAHLNLGICYGKQGDRQKQIHHLEQAVKLKPDMVDAHYDLGLAYADAMMYPQAIAAFHKVIELRPAYQDSHFQIGIILYKTKKYADAASEFQQCLQLSPNWFEAHLNLGSCYLKTENIDDAIRHFGETVKLKPESAEAHYSLGIAYMKAERYGEASAFFQKALKLDPYHRQARMMLKELETYKVDKKGTN